VDLGADGVTELCGHRSTFEATFRDSKDIPFGLGLAATHVHDPGPRDRLLVLTAIAQVLLLLLVAAGARRCLDRPLKVSTTKQRTVSLLDQGKHWHRALPNLREERQLMLLQVYDAVLREHAITQELFAVLRG